MKKIFVQITVAFILISTGKAFSNNIIISNIVRGSDNTVSFDIGWENSWRENSNVQSKHDAVWVFIKIKGCGTLNNASKFSHLNINASGHTFSSEITSNPIDPFPDNTGIMLRKASAGNGSVAGTVTLSVSFPTASNYEIKVFGIEMTYVQPGAFYVGDGASLYRFGKGNDLAQPFYIQSETSPISVGNSAGSLYTDAIAGTPMPPNPIPGAFPKGVNGFYCMKTEITQQLYVDFLNSLDFTQFIQRFTPAAETSTIYTVKGNWPNVHSGDFPDRAMGVIDWADLTGFLDWAALRPMTELEFEKVCRGPNQAIPNEQAWGEANGKRVQAKTNTSCETVLNVGEAGVCNFSDLLFDVGVLRVGFLGTATSTRNTIGAGYYGNTELSGNLLEQIVSVLSEGVGYTGKWGDGELDDQGNPNVANWPALIGNGHFYRGGSWYTPLFQTNVSDRSFIRSVHGRYSNVGGRGCR